MSFVILLTTITIVVMTFSVTSNFNYYIEKVRKKIAYMK